MSPQACDCFVCLTDSQFFLWGSDITFLCLTDNGFLFLCQMNMTFFFNLLFYLEPGVMLLWSGFCVCLWGPHWLPCLRVSLIFSTVELFTPLCPPCGPRVPNWDPSQHRCVEIDFFVLFWAVSVSVLASSKPSMFFPFWFECISIHSFACMWKSFLDAA